MVDYIRLVKELVASGMEVDKALALVANAYGLDLKKLQGAFENS